VSSVCIDSVIVTVFRWGGWGGEWGEVTIMYGLCHALSDTLLESCLCCYPSNWWISLSNIVVEHFIIILHKATKWRFFLNVPFKK